MKWNEMSVEEKHDLINKTFFNDSLEIKPWTEDFRESILLAQLAIDQGVDFSFHQNSTIDPDDLCYRLLLAKGLDI